MHRTTDPIGVMIVRVLTVVCGSCNTPVDKHRNGGGCGCWRPGGHRYVPDRPVPVLLRAALAH